MGNCQAAEAATVVIQHPAASGNKVERIYCSVSANEIMNSNPGHYVAQVVAAPPPARQLRLLRPDDTLIIGQVYRLICFEDVLKEFAAKKCVKLGRLLKERGAINVETKNCQTEQHHLGGGGGGGSSGRRGGVRHHGGSGQWRPALHSISELGT